MPAPWSMAVVCTVAISCWPKVLRTISSPLDKGAYRNVWSAPPGPSERMVAVSDFSGLTSSACALASAAARLAMDGLDLCMATLHADDIKAHRPRLRTLGPNAVPDRLFGILRHQTLQFRLGLFVFEMRRTGPREGSRKLRPGIGGAHVDNADRLDARFWRLDAEQQGWLAALDTAPELPFRGDDEVLIQRIGMSGDLHPLASPGDHRKHRRLCRHHPHIVLQLRHVLLGGRFLRERPRQHELGFEDRPTRLDPSVQRRRHPAHRRMPDPALDVDDDLPRIELVPAPVQVLSDGPSWTMRLPDRSSGSTSPRFSRQSRTRATSSLPITIRASEPPMNVRLSAVRTNFVRC